MAKNKYIYWYQPYLTEFFIHHKNKYIHKKINDLTARELLISEFGYINTKSIDDPPECVKSYKRKMKCLFDIYNIDDGSPKSNKDDNSNGRNKFIHAEFDENYIYGKEKKYNVSIFLLSFIKLDLYYQKMIKEKKRLTEEEKYALCGYYLTQGKSTLQNFFPNPNYGLKNIDDFAKLTSFLDKWASMLLGDLQHIHSSDKYKDFYHNLNEEKILKYISLVKKHFFLYYIVPEMYSYMNNYNFERLKNDYCSELNKICNKNFKDQTIAETKSNLNNNFNDYKNSLNEILNASNDYFLKALNILKSK